MVEGKSDTISVDGTLTLSDDDVVSITSGAISPHQVCFFYISLHFL